MTAGLDTSVVVRLLTGEPEELALVALRYLQDQLRAGECSASDRRPQVTDVPK